MASIWVPISKLPCASMIFDRRMQAKRCNSFPSPGATCMIGNTKNSLPSFFKSTWAVKRKSVAYQRPQLAKIPHCGTSNLDTGPQDENRVRDTVQRLYAALKNKSSADLSELVGDDCRCGIKFASFLHPFGDKNQALALLMYLIKTWGRNISIFVQPMSKDGMVVGLKWTLELKKSYVALGRGLTLQTSHAYRGKVLISNLEILVGPHSYLQLFKQRVTEFATVAFGRISSMFPKGRIKEWMKKQVFAAALLFALKLFFG